MPFGISPAGEIFQQRLDQEINDLDGVRTVADDILVIGNGETMQEAVADHDRKLKELFDCCRAKHIKLNPNKIELKKTSMPYTGNILTSDGVQADLAKVQAILEMKQPTDVAGVRRILGTVNYLAKFLPQATSYKHLNHYDNSQKRISLSIGTNRMTPLSPK
ncbi:Transposon Ty3-G Gag-Pol poly [Paramuricea clavata]|uniref:Transposon Ty3-G Gag-Pol poly n=1 Tax=Paramuricea clavata TaxID=317549 RepID=A0A6S7JKE0_PARCT|nr:Transposon Ty3-G Gag-Pol poly [Paramuricea clavata]